MAKSNVADWAIKAGAIVLAVLLWFHAITEHTYERRIEIPLRVDDPDSESTRFETIVANQTPRTVTVLVSGKGKELLRLSPSDLLATLNPEGPPGSARAYRIEPDNVELKSPELEILVEEVIYPREIQIELDRRANKIVPVIPRVNLQIANAHTQLGDIHVSPSSVSISGPSKQLRSIRHIETDSLVRRNVVGSVNELVGLRRPPDLKLELMPAEVTLRVDVQALAEDDIHDVPVAVRHARDKGVTTEPATVDVKVKGAVSVIANLKPEKDLILYVDYRDFSGSSLRILAAVDTLFEISQINPPEVTLVEY